MKKLLLLFILISASIHSMEPEKDPTNLLLKADSYLYGLNKKKVNEKQAYDIYQQIINHFPNTVHAFQAQIMATYMAHHKIGTSLAADFEKNLQQNLTCIFQLTNDTSLSYETLMHERLSSIADYAKKPKSNPGLHVIGKKLSHLSLVLPSLNSYAVLNPMNCLNNYINCYRQLVNTAESIREAFYKSFGIRHFSGTDTTMSPFLDIPDLHIPDRIRFLNICNSWGEFFILLIETKLKMISSKIFDDFYSIIWSLNAKNKNPVETIALLDTIAKLDIHNHQSNQGAQVHRNALFDLASFYFDGKAHPEIKDFSKAKSYLEKLLPALEIPCEEKRLQNAIYMLGHIYLVGDAHLPTTNITQAKKHFMAATQGPCNDTRAQAYLKLGQIILHHLEPNISYTLAQRYFNKALEASNSLKIRCNALLNLGSIYYRGGHGITRNYEAAKNIFIPLVAQNAVPYVKYFAADKLADIHLHDNAPESLEIARDFLGMIANQTERDCKGLRKNARKKLSELDKPL